jgi:DNA-binding transcriptional regulator YhcF (GntR family)
VVGDDDGTAPEIAVDTGSAQPPYEQVRAQIAAQIAVGSLPPGARLPTVRQLAGRLGLANNTVAKSYRSLERAGLIETRGRGGTFVAAAGEVGRRLVAAAADYAATARDVGASPAEARRTVIAVLDASQSGPVMPGVR